ncbi:hypothetical protein [Aliagarivorans taiwanensis]|uniref:hypothetical protein n=1 Tax=Aliagarivorans taiwanensis TaxID=561966 RepID=UPI000414D174|nr:hypothetical protein [Aliagarivorans taiwanensis]
MNVSIQTTIVASLRNHGRHLDDSDMALQLTNDLAAAGYHVVPAEQPTTKYIVAKVACTDRWFTERAHSVALLLTPELRQRIQNTAKQLSDNSQTSIAFDHFEALWSEAKLSELPKPTDTRQQEAAFNSYVNAMDKQFSYTELPSIEVRQSSFRITGVPKHCDKNALLHSQWFSLDILDNDALLVEH